MSGAEPGVGRRDSLLPLVYPALAAGWRAVGGDGRGPGRPHGVSKGLICMTPRPQTWPFAVPALVTSLILAAVAGCGTETDAPDPGVPSDAVTRTISHAYGETEVTDLDRVAVLDGDRTLEAVVALGVQPVAAVTPPLTGDYAPVVRELLTSEPADIGSSEGEVNLEALLAADPDLILMRGEGEAFRETYEQVSAIAPTVVIVYTPAGWRETLTQVAEVLEREDEARELVAEYDADVAALGATATDQGTLSVVRVRTDGVRYMTQDGSFPWSVLTDLGREAPPQQERGDAETQTVDVSLEQLDLLVADEIILLVDSGAEQSAQQVQDLLLQLAPTATLTQMPSKDALFGNVLSARALLDALAT